MLKFSALRLKEAQADMDLLNKLRLLLHISEVFGPLAVLKPLEEQKCIVK